MFHVKHQTVWLSYVSRETLPALERFADLLLKWNKALNLVGRQDEPFLWERHIEDSLQLLPLMTPYPGRGIDLGSGAGFPGLILALASGVPFDLVEADKRKAAFLLEAARVTSAPVTVHAIRLEAARLRPADLITARALAPLPRLLDLAAPFLAPGGACLFLKGSGARDELTRAVSRWHMHAECIPSRTAADASVLRITELSRVPRSA